MKKVFILFFLCNLISCSSINESEVYTMYRNSTLNSGLRIHVATFDTKEGEKYNRINCEDSSKLRMSQHGVVTKFWCEKGYYRK